MAFLGQAGIRIPSAHQTGAGKEMKILPLKIPIKKTRTSPKTIPRIIFPNVRKTSRKVKLTKPKVTGTYLSVRSFRIRTEMI